MDGSASCDRCARAARRMRRLPVMSNTWKQCTPSEPPRTTRPSSLPARATAGGAGAQRLPPCAQAATLPCVPPAKLTCGREDVVVLEAHEKAPAPEHLDAPRRQHHHLRLPSTHRRSGTLKRLDARWTVSRGRRWRRRRAAVAGAALRRGAGRQTFHLRGARLRRRGAVVGRSVG